MSRPNNLKRLPHGYTNLTVLDGSQVVKRYARPDAVVRRHNERAALTALAGRFPVPAVVAQDDSQIVLSYVPGVAAKRLWSNDPTKCSSRWVAPEFAHPGDPVEDLAWAEWIVRIHHPRLVESLGAMFDGYGSRPTWQQRHAAMLDKCRWALEFVRRWPGADLAALAMWTQRIEATAAFRE